VSPWVDIPSREDLTTRREISPTLRSKIRALKQLAGWTYRHISEATGVALTTVFRTCQPLVPHKGPSTRGRKQILGSKERKLLISVATEYAENRRKPLTEIAYLAGVSASEKTLRSSLACEGYHRRVARVKPYLKPAHLTVRSTFLSALFIYLFSFILYVSLFMFFFLYLPFFHVSFSICIFCGSLYFGFLFPYMYINLKIFTLYFYTT